MSGCGCGGGKKKTANRPYNNGYTYSFPFPFALDDSRMNRPMLRRYSRPLSRRANPAVSGATMVAAAAGLGGLLLGSLVRLLQGRESLGVYYISGQSVDLPQGSSFTVRLPPGDYEIPGLHESLMVMGQVKAQANGQSFTDIPILIMSAPDTFTTLVTFVNTADPSDPKFVNVIGRNLEKDRARGGNA